MMTIQNLLNEIGLPDKAFDLISADIGSYNLHNPTRQIPAIDFFADKDDLILDQLPFIGRTLAGVKGDVFLDSEKTCPLVVDENATLYALYLLNDFYN